MVVSEIVGNFLAKVMVNDEYLFAVLKKMTTHRNGPFIFSI